ncbi:hypothetical protein DFH09DRAFT_1099079 [Mycena vulgaris]|nr:hypothetical protein DFH09DRAFT_1099079 [Mycena vulgaris]
MLRAMHALLKGCQGGELGTCGTAGPPPPRCFRHAAHNRGQPMSDAHTPPSAHLRTGGEDREQDGGQDGARGTGNDNGPRRGPRTWDREVHPAQQGHGMRDMDRESADAGERKRGEEAKRRKSGCRGKGREVKRMEWQKNEGREEMQRGRGGNAEMLEEQDSGTHMSIATLPIQPPKKEGDKEERKGRTRSLSRMRKPYTRSTMGLRRRTKSVDAITASALHSTSATVRTCSASVDLLLRPGAPQYALLPRAHPTGVGIGSERARGLVLVVIIIFGFKRGVEDSRCPRPSSVRMTLRVMLLKPASRAGRAETRQRGVAVGRGSGWGDWLGWRWRRWAWLEGGEQRSVFGLVSAAAAGSIPTACYRVPS